MKNKDKNCLGGEAYHTQWESCRPDLSYILYLGKTINILYKHVMGQTAIYILTVRKMYC